MSKNILFSICMALFSIAMYPMNASADLGRSRDWLDRDWEIRYVLFFDGTDNFKNVVQVAYEMNHTPDKPGREKIYFSAEEMFEVSASYDVPDEKESISMVLILFDPVGHITSKSARLNQYTAKRNVLDTLVLVKTTSKNEKPYRLAYWSQGIPGDVSFSPAVCTGIDILRYEKNWKPENFSGNFGCREWTAQLYDSEQPYIDVTSYEKRGNFIGEFVGWSRFTDPPKPVIGMHGKTWLCLHECPAGETPGVIPDIKKWVDKHGFPMPQRPPRQPLYPNANYMDDIREEWHVGAQPRRPKR